MLAMLRNWQFWSIFPAVTLLVMLPALLSSPMLYQSFWIDIVWLDQFAEQLRNGTLYPRWLPDSHNGLGAPVFYYYPPLAFYLASAFDWLGTYTAILMTFGVTILGSGVAMYFWLRNWAQRPLLGAIIYMAAPYHLYDFYQRGALAEAGAIALIPLVALAMRRMSEGNGVIIFAISYAALIATHLPLALIASLFLILPYGLWLLREQPALIYRFAVAGIIGLLLASAYLIPALALDPYRDAEKLWAISWLRPSAWNLILPDSGISDFTLLSIRVLVFTLAIVAIALVMLKRSFWSILALISCVFASGIVPFFWSLPLVENVQFPWRSLPITEFAIATCFATYKKLSRSHVLLIAALIWLSAVIAMFDYTNSYPALDFEDVHPDVLEYLPPGAPGAFGWHSAWALELSATMQAPMLRDGITTEPTFYYPAWQIVCDGQIVRTFPDPETRLLSYRGENCARELVTTTPEKIGYTLTVLGLLFLLLFYFQSPFKARNRAE